ncbi:hypothetical protein AGABI2DRAFT_179834 [Agaricus bisporus var. bisporus H97]|uniref:hypothetical protein n=1 Tax=Agaricus bisporus var. bisporus (strain H97 / ATCC MYA-4626 / FGSC 10389) TaxID=936046 RepID=UPI00029F7B0D|nr:hypothetical protein AGABI2DRAFT_179834 [Agaricus bisporus var. bisporus H97]EKV45356.1 hypothetical protein AGABI2DRAFT_179834 [Agaricus bisporus var. bisporus H97]
MSHSKLSRRAEGAAKVVLPSPTPGHFLKAGAYLPRVSMKISPIFFLILSVLLSITDAADVVNITVDDAARAWKYSSNSSNCTARLDETRAYMTTWHDGTFDPGLGTVVSSNTPDEVLYAEFNFTGVAVYVYCILSNSKEFPSGSSDMAFYVDGEQKGAFVRDADGSPGYIYDFPVFVASSLPDGEHRLLIQSGRKGGKKVLTLLDRIVYTQNRKAEAITTSTPQPTEARKSRELKDHKPKLDKSLESFRQCIVRDLARRCTHDWMSVLSKKELAVE